MAELVRAWSEIIQIPTYMVGKPEKNPLFLEKRVYQGSSGEVYPYPVVEKIFNEKKERSYTALFIENKYLKIMILPELGGRIHMALDKTNDYHFIYFNQVIKPALVGLAGPWIAGGIEFNWPQHHRPSTFDPLDWRIDENLDGSITVWCSEIELKTRTKGMHGITLYPDKAILEVRVQLYNRTSEPQSLLWWANPAVHVNDQTQAVFPPDVYAVMDHGKRAVTEFPISTGVYYKHDYSPGTDISLFKNIPVPTSYMAYHSDFNFLGSYDHENKAGMLHVADHHIVPGKKLWTWGNGEFGKAWINELTDDDGPYIELMCGAYTDNQPDFSWLMPGEEKSFSQYFFPYKLIGPPKNANTDAAVSLGIKDGKAIIGVYVTAERIVQIQLVTPHGLVYDESMHLSPIEVFVESVPIDQNITENDLTLLVISEGSTLISFALPVVDQSQLPEPQKPIPAPQDIAHNNDIYLSGLHLEQYRHASFTPEDYYREALKRNPEDYRSNNALGLLLYRRGMFRESEVYFKTAIKNLTQFNPNPYDGEAFYNFGLALKMQNKFEEAFNAFYKATWNAAWQDASYFELARISCRKGAYADALEFTRRSLRRNYFHHKARHLRIAILRKTGETDAALREASLALELDRMEFGAMWERYLLVQDPLFAKLTHQNPNTLIEIGLDYLDAGLFLEALALLRRIPIPDPVGTYFLGWCSYQAGDIDEAKRVFSQAAEIPPDYCFPNKLEIVPALTQAVKLNPEDGFGYYLLGNFYYSHKNYEAAVKCWEKSRSLHIELPTLYRNLGLAYYNRLNKREEALGLFEYAFNLDQSDGRILFELDQLYKKLNHPPQGRLIRLDAYSSLVNERDDLTLERICLLNFLGRYDEAYEILVLHRFHPWEGGEGKVTEQYTFSLLGQAHDSIRAGDYLRGIKLLAKSFLYPSNLAEGKLISKRENNLNYYLGLAYQYAGNQEQAEKFWTKAEVGEINFDSPKYYNDNSPDMIFYQCLAKIKLGKSKEAHEILMQMLEFGQANILKHEELDYFAVSLPDFLLFKDDLNQRNRIHCNYLTGLGYLGLGKPENAAKYLRNVLSDYTVHLGAEFHLKLCLDPLIID